MKQSPHVPTLPPTSGMGSVAQLASVGSGQNLKHTNGNLAERDSWNARIADLLSAQAGITMTAEHRDVIAAVRLDFAETGEMPTLLRTSRITGLDVGRLSDLFHTTPVVTMAHIAGLRTRREPTV